MADAAVIRSIGHYIPAGRQTNDDLAREIDTSDDWVRARTGIRTRAKAGAGESTSVLASHAGKSALAGAGLAEVDAVVVATTTPDMKCPATAPLVAEDLRLTGAATFDVNSACAGFLAGLAIASGLVGNGNCRGLLLIGAEHFSSMVHGGDRGTAPIFGDGAAAVVIRPGDAAEHGAIGPVHLASDGSLRDLAHVKAGGSRQPAAPDIDPRDLYLRMDGRATYRHAVARMVGSCERTLRDRGMTIDDVDLLVAHQANARILREVARRLGIAADKAIVDLTDIGNTGAASIPIALSRAHHGGVLHGGETLLLTAFGAGASWGSTVLRWPAMPPGSDPARSPA